MGFEITGKLVEHELIGQPHNVCQPLERRRYSYKEREEIYRRNRELIMKDQLKTHYPFNPIEPSGRYPFAYNLQTQVGENLGLDQSDFDQGRLKIFTAIGTIIDSLCKVDGFFVLTTEDGEQVDVTFDLTTNPLKDQGEADTVIQIPREGFDLEVVEDAKGPRYVDQEEFDRVIIEYGQAVADKFKKKIDQFKIKKQQRLSEKRYAAYA